MTDLSPQAQAVMDAYHDAPIDGIFPRDADALGVAAALRSATDQVVPESDIVDAEEWIGQSAWQQAEQSVRFRLLAIAAELEQMT